MTIIYYDTQVNCIIVGEWHQISYSLLSLPPMFSFFLFFPLPPTLPLWGAHYMPSQSGELTICTVCITQ